MSESDKPAAEPSKVGSPTDPKKAPGASASTAAARTKPKARAKGYRPPVVEETPVISGRFLTAAAIIGGLTLIPLSCLGQKLEPKEPPPSAVAEWKVGGKSTLRITLVYYYYAGLA
jgi:hypothetical protein